MKKVTYILEEETHLNIAIRMLMKMGEGTNISKSEYLRDSLLANFKIFEDELKGGNIEQLAKLSKVFVGTKPITVTLPLEVIEKLKYYSEKLGMKKSHLVMCSIFVRRRGGLNFNYYKFFVVKTSAKTSIFILISSILGSV